MLHPPFFGRVGAKAKWEGLNSLGAAVVVMENPASSSGSVVREQTNEKTNR